MAFGVTYACFICLNFIRADSRSAPSQWEKALLCNAVSHWPGANLESALYIITGSARPITCTFCWLHSSVQVLAWILCHSTWEFPRLSQIQWPFENQIKGKGKPKLVHSFIWSSNVCGWVNKYKEMTLVPKSSIESMVMIYDTAKRFLNSQKILSHILQKETLHILNLVIVNNLFLYK